MNPRYPVYVISKGRADTQLTSTFLRDDGVPFKLVIEPQEREAYEGAGWGPWLVTLPFSNLGLGSIPARNWVWEDSIAAGAERHWILDDNIRYVGRNYKGKRIRCVSGPAFAALEDFTDRYANVGLTGMNYDFFAGATMGSRKGLQPFYQNVHVYSCLLIRNSLPYRWRGRYNEDTDLSLQVLSGGLCTILSNVFVIKKMRTMVMKGGNTSELYRGDGRLTMSRSLERAWPGIVKTRRRFGRPQHRITRNWRNFDTPLQLKEGVHVPRENNEYGLRLTQVAAEIKSEAVKRLLCPK